MPPGQVGDEFVTNRESDALLCEQVPLEPARGEIAQCSFITEQPVGVKLDCGGKDLDLVVASN